MTLPFNAHQFFAVFATYNAAIWPAQAVGYSLGLATLGALLLRHPLRERGILTGLAVMWAWNGLVYHLAFFTPINPAAYGFAALFAFQAVLLGFLAFRPNDIHFTARGHWRVIPAFSLIVYAMAIYPLIGPIAGHGLMKGPLFGAAPCPTAIFTIAMLMLVEGRMQAWLAAIPILWAIIGASAAFMLGVPEDLGLAVAAALLVLGIASRSRKPTEP